MPCRASPPQGGRLDVSSAFINRQRSRIEFAINEGVISLLVGEMAGRPEGAPRTSVSITM
ncbi:hypothetical protein C5748_01565 [Phyllobacterium phragmitis]|uniref:Uncharacterized protein n=1 Tax=Phyllobacterium phragmitis TaxID=2670329 RepID=A0A2S9IZ93_9HYPH|nr:hypothetical protein C5748_01565 [Phyllobacterium phragmitis]